ncbi:MAG: BON domain-containing protein [Legionellaceae bacterium]|nr:BON domain-containing protein [Legionellaceae bacterium]MBP9775554.1 BON domain-containing protein [Legionellaceae bacterium]
MLNKTVLYGVLAFTTISPLLVNAATSTTAIQHGLTDTAITTKIKALYVLSPVIKSLSISVVTSNHDVALMGTVETDMQYEKAISLAQSVDGVTTVNADKLLVSESKAPLADTYITAKAKGTIMKESLFGKKDVDYWPVSIETKDGVVYLSGTVDTKEQSENIVKLVTGIDGVKSVNSTINVK